MSETIRYIQRKDIDVAKWDARIEAATNGLIYARSWWLDEMADHWDALVVGDYEKIMPLTWRKKWGIKYLYQPDFTQQLGIISSQTLAANNAHSFYAQMQKSFRFAEINLNYLNPFEKTSSRKNFVLDISADYASIASHYKNDLKKNLHRSAKEGFTYSGNIENLTVVELFKDTYKNKIELSVDGFSRLNKAVAIAERKGMIVARCVNDKEEQISAASLCLKDNKRIYFLLSVIPSSARVQRANHFLVDSLIREFSRQPLLLDFEGSDIEGIAHFYKVFGAINQSYFFLRYNNLPWPISMLKG
ncbi:hypothetical protein [Pinibacter soli]|uniref:BioF2-like acetyltransferase domain-containing protein n=1 Tax=Pinibacter soli TaxID=3044211 RepID=A0ABT6RJS0_9BACT|nr:hypothetical protein [Pinibacter soli]MDI3322139.1 hypothetical protein [Pinibacter soli]